MKLSILSILMVLLLHSCRYDDNPVQKILNPSRLPVQSFIINTTRDTVVRTALGMKIGIGAGALSASSQTVTMQVMQAESIEDMVKAGLLTHSKAGTLSSDGMFSIGFAQEVTIQKAIRVWFPTRFANTKMQLYKGEKETDGKIDWTDPVPIDSFQSPVADAGKVIFANNCASCHSINRRLTGPALAWVDKRRSREWLHAMVRNPAKLMTNDIVSNCLYCRYQVLMTPFPLLQEKTMDSVFRYIDQASQQMNIPQDFNPEKECDSCAFYKEKYKLLRDRQDSLLERKQGMIRKDNVAAGGFRNNAVAPVAAPASSVAPVEYESFDADYYQFDITTTGWYNIDILLHECDGVKESMLMVRLQGSYQERVKLYLVIPSVKVFAEGGLLNDKKLYGFDKGNGGIALPQGAPAIVFGISEKDEKLYYAETRFTTSLSQTLTAELREASQTQILSSLSTLNIRDAAITKVTTKEDAIKLEEVNQEIKKILPYAAGCACNSDAGTLKAAQ